MNLTYIWKDPKTGVTRYVGKGVRISRAYSHIARSTNPQLGALLAKRKVEGFDLIPTIITATSDEDAIEMEMLLIALIGREDLGLGTLFNHTDGGDGVVCANPSTRQKISDAARKQYQQPGARELTSKNSRRQWDTPGAREALSLQMSKPCTVDGVTIYPSRQALKRALGRGNTGDRNPNFRFVECNLV